MWNIYIQNKVANSTTILSQNLLRFYSYSLQSDFPYVIIYLLQLVSDVSLVTGVIVC